MIEVLLMPGGCLLPDGQMLSTDDRGEIARILLANGMDPRTRLVIRSKGEIIADDQLGVVTGAPVGCGDIDVVERD